MVNPDQEQSDQDLTLFAIQSSSFGHTEANYCMVKQIVRVIKFFQSGLLQNT